MNRQYQILVLTISALLSLLAFVGCSSAGKTAKSISVESGQTLLTPDSTGTVEMNLLFHIPRKYVPARSRLFITPQLIVDDSLCAELTPLVVDAPIYMKKMKRRASLEKYQDPYSKFLYEVEDPLSSFNMEYNTRFDIPAEARSGFIRAIVSKDGCGECSGLDTLYIAGISNPVSLIDTREALNLSWIEPEFVVRPKIRKGKGEALLQFVINKYDINLSLGNNREEMMRMVNTLAPILADSLATIRDMSIYGMASADGPYGFNTKLARNRASSAKQWLIDKLQINPKTGRLIRTDSRPEGWWPVYNAMVADGHSDSLRVRQILTTYTKGNDDVQEYYIRRLSCWPDIRNKYLAKDRKVEYTYSYIIRSFTTDEELLSMYRVRPDAFNEDELLRVAALSVDDTAKKEVYGVLMHYFPQSVVAANNLAVLYLRDGDIEKARQTLLTQQESSPEKLATLAASYIYENDYERAVELLQKIDLPEARYNLGLVRARQYKLNEAYSMLKDYRDVNTAIVALSLARNAEAREIMNEIQDQSPLAEYVRALIAARLHDEAAFSRHIKNACKERIFRERAITEPDFEKFQNILNDN